jgi:hypothetical protein
MMSEIDANQSVQGRPGNSYGYYEGQPRGSAQSIPPYEMPYQQPSPGGAIDDNFVEAVSQRIAQQIGQQSTGKVYGQKRKSTDIPADQRTGIAIVSVLVLVPLGIVLGQQGVGGLLALGLVGLVIMAVNMLANGVLSSRD